MPPPPPISFCGFVSSPGILLLWPCDPQYPRYPDYPAGEIIWGCPRRRDTVKYPHPNPAMLFPGAGEVKDARPFYIREPGNQDEIHGGYSGGATAFRLETLR